MKNTSPEVVSIRFPDTLENRHSREVASTDLSGHYAEHEAL
jgi:hypothetical protein